MARPFSVPWPALGWALIGVPSVILSVVLVAVMFSERSVPFDWWLWREAAARVFDGTLYEWGATSPYGAHQPYAYRYGPLFAALTVPFTALGLEAWRLLHLAALALLPWRLALVTLAFAPFWYDVLHGNVLTFAFVLGFLAVRGSRWATLGYFALLAMVPRPLMLPVSAWIVWQRPEWRVPAICGGLVGLAQLAYPGFASALIRSVGASDVFGELWPPGFIGVAWVPIGLALGAWLTWKGRLGLASLAVSPYWLPYYLLMLLLEAQSLTRKHSTRRSCRCQRSRSRGSASWP